MKQFSFYALLLSTLAAVNPAAGGGVTALTPPAISGYGGTQVPQPTQVIGYDSGTGAPCIVGSTPTCSVPTSTGGTVTVTHIQTAALASSLVVKATPGDLYSFEVSADSTLSGAAWWLLIFDATSAPADGTVTPAKCFAYSLGITSASYAFPTPVQFTTGVTMVVSTTGCFTKTASAHAFLAGDYQ